MRKKADGKHLFVACLLGFAMLLCFSSAKSRYAGTDILETLRIPYEMGGWISRDVSNQIDLKDAAYNDLGHVFERQYTNDMTRKSLVFFVYDANKFHHPQICFVNSGYEVRPMKDMEIDASGRRFKIHMLFMKKKQGSMLVVYWICLDKKVTDWTQQKIRQIFYTLFNKKKTGLMGRLDIPASERNIQEAVRIAKDFIPDISRNMKPEDADYLFGTAS